MSHKIVSQCTARLNRSEQAVPGSNPTFMEKASKGSADVVFLDLEDAVAPDEKEQARKNVIEALHELDWTGKTVSVRINGLDTQYMYRDVVDVMEQVGDKLDLIMIPKAGTASDIYMVDALVNQIEIAKGYTKRIGFEMIIETALGMQNVHEIASACTRNESLHFGVADYAASTQARTINIGGPNPDYSVLTDADEAGKRDLHWGDMWHLRAVDGPFGDISDPDGFAAQARRSAVLGCEGKWAIHPSQVDVVNEIFSPSEEEVTRAKRVISAMDEAKREGRGAVTLDGRLIDLASIRQAEVLVRKAEVISSNG